MLFRFVCSLLILVVAGPSAGIFAQEPEVIVGEIGFPEHTWGKQKLPFEVTNRTDWLKFLVVETDVGFEDSYVTPHRITRTNFILEPAAKLTIEPVLEIPGNYGRMTLWVRIFDVVDTLDDMSLGRQLFEQPFKIRFPTPEAVLPYFQERLTMPPLVGTHGMFDNEFERLMLILTYEEKSLSEIAEMCQVDIDYVTATAEDMAGTGYLLVSDGAYRPAISVITSGLAKAGRLLADQAADQLAEKITENLSQWPRIMDSLVQAGVYSNDSTNFFEGGTLLYQRYPLVTGLYLWRFLGQKFITDRQPLLIFANTDPCQPKIGRFMYMVQGGDYYNGNHYYSAEASRSDFNAHFGDRIPVVECHPGFEKKFRARQNVDWNYAKEYFPETFLYDTLLINPMLRVLDQGVEEILRTTIGELRQIHKEQGYDGLTLGARYWFWNLTATRTVVKLVESGALIRSGNGQYRLMEKSG